jgi:hypothetical protein
MASGPKVQLQAQVRTDPPDPALDDPAEIVAIKYPVKVIIDWGTSTLVNGHETVVGAVATSVLAADPNRKTAVIQNVGTVNVRVGVAGVTATTGARLVPNGVFISDEPFVSTQEFFAVREGAVDGLVFATEAT